ncbi:MAG: phage portal protein [Promethearchaeota archaeon]
MKQQIGFRDRINLIKGAFTRSPTKSFLRTFMPTLGEPPRRSTQDWFALYNKSPRMGPIHQIASDVGSATYGIYNKTDSKKIKIKNHAIEQLLKVPNTDKTMTEYTLFYLTESYLLLPSGESFWLKERNKLGKVTELWVVPPHWVSEIPSKAKPYFTIQPTGNMQAQPVYVMPEDIVYFKRPDAENPYLRGIGRAEGIGDELETDEYMSKYSKRYFFNGAIPDMVGMMPGADEATINRTDEIWKQKYGGFNNAHKTAWLNFDAKFQILKENAKDMDYINSRIYLADATRQYFGIPPELFGDIKNSNRSTIDSAYYLYTKNVLRKELTFIRDVINRQLVPDFAENIFFEHDNVVPEDAEFELKKASEGLKNGGLTVDEWRRANGWEELPNGKGKILYTPLNMMPTPLDKKVVEVNMEPQQELPKQESEKTVKKKLTIEHKNQLWQVLDKAAMKNERPFINALKRYFQDQQNKLNDELQKAVKQATDNPDDLLDWDEEAIILLGIMTPLWLQSLNEGFETVNVTFNFGLSENILQSKFLEWIDKFGAEQVKQINNTTKEKLRKTLSEGIADGESIPKLRDRDSNVMTEAKTSRAEKIART